jgi:hypothetical protein
MSKKLYFSEKRQSAQDKQNQKKQQKQMEEEEEEEEDEDEEEDEEDDQHEKEEEEGQADVQVIKKKVKEEEEDELMEIKIIEIIEGNSREETLKRKLAKANKKVYKWMAGIEPNQIEGTIGEWDKLSLLKMVEMADQEIREHPDKFIAKNNSI